MKHHLNLQRDIATWHRTKHSIKRLKRKKSSSFMNDSWQEITEVGLEDRQMWREQGT